MSHTLALYTHHLGQKKSTVNGICTSDSLEQLEQVTTCVMSTLGVILAYIPLRYLESSAGIFSIKDSKASLLVCPLTDTIIDLNWSVKGASGIFNFLRFSAKSDNFFSSSPVIIFTSTDTLLLGNSKTKVLFFVLSFYLFN